MAGAWIKFDISTPDKPEVRRIARLLKLDRDCVVGKLVRLWSWFDQNSVDGCVDGVVSTDVDDICGHAGFAAAVEGVGWVECDDEAERVTLPNFGRHNGQTAKTRASKSRRQAEWRKSVDAGVDANVDDPVDAKVSTSASTREEKSNTGTNVPDGDAPSRKEFIWRQGVQVLTRAGLTESAARSFLGKHARTDERKLAGVIGTLLADPKLEPRAYIEQAMKPKRRSAA